MASALPMPRPAPVTIATLPFSLSPILKHTPLIYFEANKICTILQQSGKGCM
jgi:hypothetical protein